MTKQSDSILSCHVNNFLIFSKGMFVKLSNGFLIGLTHLKSTMSCFNPYVLNIMFLATFGCLELLEPFLLQSRFDLDEK